MHYVDDFLLLTRDPNTAKTFLETMTKGTNVYFTHRLKYVQFFLLYS